MALYTAAFEPKEDISNFRPILTNTTNDPSLGAFVPNMDAWSWGRSFWDQLLGGAMTSIALGGIGGDLLGLFGNAGAGALGGTAAGDALAAETLGSLGSFGSGALEGVTPAFSGLGFAGAEGVGGLGGSMPSYTLGNFGAFDPGGDLYGVGNSAGGYSIGGIGSSGAPVEERLLPDWSKAATADSSILRGLTTVGQGLLGGGAPSWMSILGPAVQGILGYYGAGKAADAMKDIANQNRELMQPWLNAALPALNTMSAGVAPGAEFNRQWTLADYDASPHKAIVQNQLTNLQKGLTNQYAAQGLKTSGPFAKAMQDRQNQLLLGNSLSFGQDWRAQQGERFGRLGQVAGFGPAAVGQTVNINNDLGNVAGASTMAQMNSLANILPGISRGLQDNAILRNMSSYKG